MPLKLFFFFYAGPPDIPVISGSLIVVENVETRLTCTADLGYPDDWYLAWSNEGIPIENQPDTTAVISRTSERFLFISRLDFTPKRQDNTHFITCTASRASWTSTPEKTWGPVNVQCRYLHDPVLSHIISEMQFNNN